jgi:N-methylhydantoinase B
MATVAICLRSVMQENVPNNAGIFRPMKIIAPAGTVLNVVMPGASSMRGVTCFRLIDVVFGAFAQFLPNRVFAASEGGNSLIVIGGQREDRQAYVFFELLTGTWGARPDRDGVDGICNIANVVSNIPIEQAEVDYPVRIDRYGFVRDTGGVGKFRGGLALEREWTLLKGEAHLAIRSDRRDHPPYGLFGGGSGASSMNIQTHSDRKEVLPTMISTRIKENEKIYHQQPGGGGYGQAIERSPAAVAWDVKNDKVSLEAARDKYGVALDPRTFEVDEAGTTALRAKVNS